MDFKLKITEIYENLFSTEEQDKYRSMLNFVLDEEYFVKGSGSGTPTQHHYGDGQLIAHTYEVMKLSLDIADNDLYQLSTAKKQKLFWAALYHDYGKALDYAKYRDPTDGSIHWGKTDHYKKIYHISRSAAEWIVESRKAGYHVIDSEEVFHAILAHHQLPEWGSPVQPATEIAWILHLADSLSARLASIVKYE